MKYLLILLMANMSILTSWIVDKLSISIYSGYEWDVMQFCDSIAFLLLLSIIFQKIPKNNINERSLIALFMYYISYNLLAFWPLVLNKTYSLYPLYILVLIFVIRAYIVNKRNHKEHSDPIIKNNIYLCFERPTKTRGVFTSLLGSPFSSLSIYAKENLYGFKWSKTQYLKRPIRKSIITKKYLVFDTKTKASSEFIETLDSLIGSKASWLLFRIKCIWIIRGFLGKLGSEYKPSFIEFIPSIFSKKIIGLKHER